ncbi:DUF572-domain-containing protein [Rhizoclosmatium globosum]|uniref:Splicing factor YJU2 n=1 Tax=Rhizoclosmatium globosum TaxID=329046 RepID=A0A1Y2CLE3_9FUNG|nr:DUF572-domain-containing protein [Rhizoclosmatium globosum]|eukprot:ORY47767.1 DUF572-domain-containing protein [Rhizoclosmatium globosum]
MSERKVLNKYFPPDFDPAKIPRRKMALDAQHKVRLMAPFSMRCDTCGDYVYKGKKFNARKERVEGENYLGIQIFRFYIRCPKCAAEITFKTDPQNSDYTCEHGAQRNFEPWREETDVNELKKAEKEKEEENNPMKALENRTVASKVEMDILDALDEIRTRNAATERVDVEDVLGRLQDRQRKQVERILQKQDEEDEAIARAIFQTSDDGLAVRRLVDDEGAGATGGFVPPVDALDGIVKVDVKASVAEWGNAASSSGKKRTGGVEGLIVVSKKAKAGSSVKPEAEGKGKEKAAPKPPQAAVGISLLAAYGSDSDEE